MPENNEKKIVQTDSPLVGSSTTATTASKNKVLTIDTDSSLLDNIIGAGINNQLNIAELDNFTNISNNRDQIYQLIDTMMHDSAVAAIVRTFAADTCLANDAGNIVWAESTKPEIAKYINYLLRIMDVDKQIYGWAYNLVTYGDVYLRLFRESDYDDELFKAEDIDKAYKARNVLNENLRQSMEESVNVKIPKPNDRYSYYVEMVPNPGTMFELTKYGKTYGYVETPDTASTNTLNYLDTTTGTDGTYGSLSASYHMRSNDVNVYQATDFVHAFLADGESRYPESVDLFMTDEDYKAKTNARTYRVRRGKSILYDSYKVWREKSLLEASVLLTRLTRSSVVQTVQVEVGDMSKEQTRQTLRHIKTLFEQQTALNPGGANGAGGSMSEYTNPGAIVNTVYLATHNGQGSLSIGSLGGDVNIKDLADLDNWNNKFYASYGIPKQYFGLTDDAQGFNGGSSLTIISSVYARLVRRIQNALRQMITDAINLFLLDRGFSAYIDNFTICMQAPLTQEEKDYRDSLTSRISAISNIQSLFTDIEDRSKRLQITKELLSTLDFGVDVQEILQKEIDEEEVNKRKAAEAEKKETEEAAASLEDEELPPLGEDLEIQENSQTITEDGYDIITEDENLPTPEDADKEIDFTKNI